MKILAKTAGMDTGTWLEARRKGIGGSDVSIIAGINNYKSVFTLWQEKIGDIELREAQTDYTYWGNVLEDVVRKEFAIRTGLKVRTRKAIMQHPKYEFMLANVDGIVNDPKDGMCIFEAKTASEYKKDIWERKVPEEYQLQVQHYMAVTGYKKAFVAALVGGNGFFIHEVYRDDELISLMIELEKQFWKCVLNREMPKANGDDATTKWLNENYLDTNSNTILLTEESTNLVDRYLEINDSLKTLNKQKSEVANHLKQMIGNNEIGVVGDKRVKWITVEKRQLNVDKLKSDHPDLYQKYSETGKVKRFSVS